MDAVALCDLRGIGSTACVVWQGTYDAYGSVLTAEQLFPHAYLRAGHKGLFFDRLDVGVINPSSGFEEKRLEPGARLIGQVRNRAYSPDLGRFVQGDPNAAGQILVTSVMQGLTPSADLAAFDLGAHYGDGANVYEYLGSSAWGRSDPLGLAWDPFDDVDDFLAEDAASKAAFMADLRQGFDTALHVGLQVAQLLPGVGTITTLYQIVANGGTVTALDLIGLLPGGKAVGLVGKAFKSYWKGRRVMRAARKAGALADDVYELHHVVPQFMTGWARGRVVVLTQEQHRVYHRILDEVLGNNGMPISNHGQDAWRRFLENNPDRLNDVRAALLESVDQFKRHAQGGVDLTTDLLTEMSRQGFALLPP